MAARDSVADESAAAANPRGDCPVACRGRKPTGTRTSIVMSYTHSERVPLLVFLGLIVCTLAAQSPRRGLSPVPPWAGEQGRIDGQYVYVDLKTQEYLLHYPNDLEALSRREPPRTTEYTTVRFGRHLSKPVIDVEVEKTDTGYRYRYTVANSADAAQEIKRFMVVTASDDYSGTLRHESERPWTGNPVAPNMRPRFTQSAVPLLGASNKGMLLWWSGAAQSDAIAPGQSREGFILESKFRPGFSTAYAVGGESLKAPRGGFPPVIAEQLTRVTRPEWEYRRVLTLGPRFSSSVPVELVANDWTGTIRRLQVTGELAESVYAASALGALRATRESAVLPATLDLPQPKGKLESMIDRGLRLSLGLQ